MNRDTHSVVDWPRRESRNEIHSASHERSLYIALPWTNLFRHGSKPRTATIIETNNKAFGLRKVKVRFHNNNAQEEGSIDRLEQYVPTDWIVFSEEQQCTTRPILPDNSMHQSPYPTIHIINNKDLASLCVRDVSRVKRLNSKRMTKLGWEGVEQHLAR